MTVLLVREPSDELTQRARELVRGAFPDQDVRAIAAGESTTARGATVVLPWRGRPWAVAPLVAGLRRRLAGQRVHWTDVDRGTLGRCNAAFFVREGVRFVGYRTLDAMVRGIAVLLRRPQPPDAVGTTTAPASGPIALILGTLPDLSHTFVYREVLAARAQDHDAQVVCLEEGRTTPVHPEAAALREHASYLPRRGIIAHHTTVLRWMLCAPRRVGGLLALYADQPGGLFGKGPFREPRHPGRGFELASALRRLGPRHIHVYGSTYAANVAMEAACLLDVPFSISSYVDFDFDYEFKMLDQKYRLARFFRVCTEFCQQRMLELVAGADTTRLPMIVWGLDLHNWTATAKPPGRGVLFTAARLVEKKGLHLVPPALQRLAERGCRFRWRVAGDGPELARLRALVRQHDVDSHVDFLGPLSNDQVRSELQHTDLALLPCVVAADGERDGIPIFLTEAMATGVPVHTTPVSGIPELVRDGDTGFLAEPDNLDSLVDKLESVLRHTARRRAVANRGRDEVHRTQNAAHSASALLCRIDASTPGGER